MSNAFRELLQKVGSGTHTGKNLTRAEAAAATRMMLQAEATPAQIGAFLIAHRIKRPTGEELAGMLDAYDELGPKLQPIQFPHRVTVLSCPYDGRSRTAPITPITALLLASTGVPVILHGGNQMPTKYGVPLIEIWQGLGVDWSRLSLSDVQQVLEKTLLGFVYLANHFPLAEQMVPYRDQIGKRPPLSTLELMWCPYAGDAHIVSGFVHPPTENMFREAFELRGTTCFTTVKGLEGSCDLPRDRTAIIGMAGAIEINGAATPFERLHLSPRDYGFPTHNTPLESTGELIRQMQTLLEGESSPLLVDVLWSGGFYLWRCGVSADLAAGIAKTEALLKSGTVAAKLAEICQSVDSLQRVTHQS